MKEECQEMTGDQTKKKEVQRVEDDRALAEVVSVGGDADSSCHRLPISKMALYVCMMIFQYTAPSRLRNIAVKTNLA